MATPRAAFLSACLTPPGADACLSDSTSLNPSSASTRSGSSSTSAATMEQRLRAMHTTPLYHEDRSLEGETYNSQQEVAVMPVSSDGGQMASSMQVPVPDPFGNAYS